MVQAERQVNRKQRAGTVVSSANDKTVIVAVSRATRHRLYRKVIRQTKRYAVHDPDNRATVGDLVTIEESRPISKTKRWRLVDVMTERDVAEVAPTSLDEALVDEMQRTAARAAAEAGETGGAGADAAARAGTETEPAETAATTEMATAETATTAETAPAETTTAETATAETRPPRRRPLRRRRRDAAETAGARRDGDRRDGARRDGDRRDGDRRDGAR